MRLLFVIALVGCGSESSDVVGPFTGTVQRFVVDRIAIARDGSEAAAVADDLDGDGAAENQFGNVTGVLNATTDLTSDGPDMIASGALASVIEIQADDLIDDPAVSVRYLGAEGESAVVAGGRFTGGAYLSNRTRDTRAPGQASVHLPIYVNASPIVLELDGLEVQLTPDGSGGYDGIVRGGFDEEAARAAAYAGLIEMFETEPERHLVFARGIDGDQDDVVSRAEVDESVIAILVSADIDLFDGARYAPRVSETPDSISVAFGIHLAPCAAGRCAMAAPVNTCRDRIRDGNETDIDCGGSCQPCWTAKTCSAPQDCQSQACDANKCRAPSCSDGVQDGYESDVDCGGACSKCAVGRTCAADRDCVSNNCDNGVATLGTCR